MSKSKSQPQFLMRLKSIIFKSDSKLLPDSVQVDMPLEDMILLPLSARENEDNSVIEAFVLENILSIHKLGLLEPMIDNVISKKMLNSKYSENIYNQLNDLSHEKKHTANDLISLFEVFGQAANKKLYPKSMKDSGAVMISQLLREGSYSAKYLDLYKSLFENSLEKKKVDIVGELLKLFFRRGFVYWAFNLDPEKYNDICDIAILKETDWQLWLQNDRNKRKSNNCEIDIELLSFLRDKLVFYSNGTELQMIVCTDECTILLRNFFRLVIECGQTSPRIKKILNQERGWITKKTIFGVVGLAALSLLAFALYVGNKQHKAQVVVNTSTVKLPEIESLETDVNKALDPEDQNVLTKLEEIKGDMYDVSEAAATARINKLKDDVLKGKLTDPETGLQYTEEQAMKMAEASYETEKAYRVQNEEIASKRDKITHIIDTLKRERREVKGDEKQVKNLTTRIEKANEALQKIKTVEKTVNTAQKAAQYNLAVNPPTRPKRTLQEIAREMRLGKKEIAKEKLTAASNDMEEARRESAAAAEAEKEAAKKMSGIKSRIFGASNESKNDLEEKQKDLREKTKALSDAEEKYQNAVKELDRQNNAPGIRVQAKGKAAEVGNAILNGVRHPVSTAKAGISSGMEGLTDMGASAISNTRRYLGANSLKNGAESTLTYDLETAKNEYDKAYQAHSMAPKEDKNEREKTKVDMEEKANTVRRITNALGYESSTGTERSVNSEFRNAESNFKNSEEALKQFNAKLTKGAVLSEKDKKTMTRLKNKFEDAGSRLKEAFPSYERLHVERARASDDSKLLKYLGPTGDGDYAVQIDNMMKKDFTTYQKPPVPPASASPAQKPEPAPPAEESKANTAKPVGGALTRRRNISSVQIGNSKKNIYNKRTKRNVLTVSKGKGTRRR